MHLLKKCGDVEFVMKVFSERPAGVDSVFVHGDFWPNNILFHGDELVAAVDWQTFHTG